MVAITGQAASSTSCTRRPTRSSTSCACSSPSRSGTPASERPSRSPRSCARRSAWRRSRSPGRPTSSCPRTSRRPTSPGATGPAPVPLTPGRAYFPEPTDEAIAHAARLIAGVRTADHPGRQRRPPTRRRAGAAGAGPRAARPGRGDVHGQGRDRRPVAPVADGGRASRRATTCCPGFDRADLVVCVGYDPVEYAPSSWNPDGTKRIIHIDTQPAEVDAAYRPEVELIGDIDGIAAAAAGRGPAARRRRPRRARAARIARDPRPRRPAHAAARRARGARGERRLADQAAAGDRRPAPGARADRHRGVATSAPTRSGSRGCTRRTSRTRSSSRTGSRRWASPCRARSRPSSCTRIARSSPCAATAGS